MRVLILGAGTAGVTLALRLLEGSSNASVTMVDAGPHVLQGDHRAWLDFVAQGSDYLPYNQLQEKKDEQEDDGTCVIDINGSRYFGVGGSTNAWGGWCLRYRPEDFFLRTNTGKGADWPFDLDHLLPYYKRAEQTLWVASPSGPNPTIPYTLKDGIIIEALSGMGISYEPLPLARRKTCVTIGTCCYCPIEKRYTPYPDLDALAKKFKDRFLLRDETVADELVMKSRDTCSGVRVRSKKSGYNSEVLDADLVVVALGAIESPKLLLSSKSSGCATGVGNSTGHVGRHITAHPLVRKVGVRTNNSDNLEQPVDFPTMVSRHFDTEEHQSRGKLLFVRDGRKNATNVQEFLRSGQSLAATRDSMRDRMPFELRGFVEIFSDDDSYVGLGSKQSSFGGVNTKVRFSKTTDTTTAIAWAENKFEEILRNAGCEDLKTKTYKTIRADHATSTCRMSRIESDGVVNPDLRVYGTDNVFICSNAAIPNGAAVNPTLTLIALAERLADHLVAMPS